MFLSLLPEKLIWSKWRIGGGDERSQRLDGGALKGEEIKGLRIQILQTLSFRMAMADDPNSSTSIGTNMLTAPPGEVEAQREIDADEDPLAPQLGEIGEDRQGDTIFGIALRQKVENRPKQGALPTKTLDSRITLRAGGTVGDALAAAGRATSLEILADLRVRNLSVTAPSSPLRTGDLLDALALGVGGTYRKIGSAYLLTSDLLGAGQRQVRVKAWEEAVWQSIAARETEWRRALAATHAFEDVGFASGDKTAPDPLLQPFLEGEAKTNDPYPVTSAMLTQGQREFLRRFQAGSPSQKFDVSRVGVERSYGFRFVLPDGTPLRELFGELGRGDQFRSRTASTEPTQEVADPKPIARTPESPLTPLLVRTELPTEAAQAVALARSHGIREVWIETSNAGALREALKGGVGMRLVVRPWTAEATTPAGELDRTMFGDDGMGLRKRWAQEPLGLGSGEERYQPPQPIENVLSPKSASWMAHIRRYASLAQTPGLQGLALVGTAPHGYEGGRDTGIRSDYPVWVAASGAFGYTDASRLEFLRTDGVDPIDLGWDSLHTTIDLRPDFFPDRSLANLAGRDASPDDSPPVSGLLKKWDNARNAANIAAMTDLLRAMPPLPLEIEGRSGLVNASPAPLHALVAWSPGEPLPVFPFGFATGSPTERYILSATLTEAPQILGFLKALVFKPDARLGRPPVLDLSNLPSKEWGRFLDQTFARSGR